MGALHERRKRIVLTPQYVDGTPRNFGQQLFRSWSRWAIEDGQENLGCASIVRRLAQNRHEVLADAVFPASVGLLADFAHVIARLKPLKETWACVGVEKYRVEHHEEDGGEKIKLFQAELRESGIIESQIFPPKRRCVDTNTGLLPYRCQAASTIDQTQPLNSLLPHILGGHERDKASDRVSRDTPETVRVHRAHKVHDKVPPQLEAVLSAAEVWLARRAKAEEVDCVDAEACVGEGRRVLAEVLH